MKIGSIDMKIISDDRLRKEADAGNLIFACMPTKYGPSVVSDSKTVQCEKCQQDVWISPSTYSKWQSCDAPIMCVECIKIQMTKE